MANEATLSLPKQLREIPEKTIPELPTLYYLVSAITRPSHIRKQIGESTFEQTGVRRPLNVLTERAELLRTLKATPTTKREERQKIIHDAHLRDEIALQSLNQGDISVPFDGGIIKSTYMHIEPPEEKVREKNTRGLPPIVLIPGISNDPECIGSLARELAFNGRRVHVLGYPASSVGHVTENFVEHVESDENFETHAKFFRAALDELLKTEPKIELLGQSTGCPIVTNLLSDAILTDHVTNAYLVTPASAVTQTEKELMNGITTELIYLKQYLPKLPNYWYGIETSVGEQKIWKKRIQDALKRQDCMQSPSWKTARVIEGGQIIVISGQKDRITKSSDFYNKKMSLPYNKKIRSYMYMTCRILHMLLHSLLPRNSYIWLGLYAVVRESFRISGYPENQRYLRDR